GRDAALVVGAVDEEAAGLDRRQAGQGHGQPVGVGQLVDGDGQAVVGLEPGLDAGGLVVGGREGVDPPDAAILILLEDGIGGAFQQRIGVEVGGGGFGDGPGAPRNNLNCR